MGTLPPFISTVVTDGDSKEVSRRALAHESDGSLGVLDEPRVQLSGPAKDAQAEILTPGIVAMENGVQPRGEAIIPKVSAKEEFQNQANHRVAVDQPGEIRVAQVQHGAGRSRAKAVPPIWFKAIEMTRLVLHVRMEKVAAVFLDGFQKSISQEFGIGS
jgi:hypothetical protein